MVRRSQPARARICAVFRKLAPHAQALVQADDAPRALDGFFRVERKTCVDLGGDAPAHVPEDLSAELHREPVHGDAGVAARFLYRVIHQRAEARILRGRQQQGRVGRRVLRLPARDGFDVAGVGDDEGMLA